MKQTDDGAVPTKLQMFEFAYRGQPADGSLVADASWDIGGPQPVLVDLERLGAITGAVLDAGCGTGDNSFI